MNAAIVELKTRARLGLNALKAGDATLLERARAVSGRRLPEPGEWKLRHAFALVSLAIGFRDWDHARRVLGGEAAPGEDMGRFWYAPRCADLLNHWFAAYGDARETLRSRPGRTLLTYARQFVVVDPPYLAELGLAGVLDAPGEAPFDAVEAYGSARWSAACMARLRAPAATWQR